MSQLCPRYFQDMSDIHPKYMAEMSKICSRHVPDRFQICPRFDKDNPKICSGYVQDMPRICPRYAKDLPKICIWSSNIYHPIVFCLPIPRERLDHMDIPNPQAWQSNDGKQKPLNKEPIQISSIIWWTGRNWESEIRQIRRNPCFLVLVCRKICLRASCVSSAVSRCACPQLPIN